MRPQLEGDHLEEDPASMSLLKTFGSQAKALLCWAGAKVRVGTRVEVLWGDGEEAVHGEDLSWAVGRTEGPQRKDCSLGF